MANPHTITVKNKNVTYYEHAADGELRRIVLFCHGFPGGNRLTTTSAKLNPLGISLVEANYRGDPGCEGKFSFAGSIEDIISLTKHLRKHYPGIPITVLGFSAGGLYAACIVRDHPDMFDKVVLLNPLLDLAFTESDIMDRLWEEARDTLTLHDERFYEHELAMMRSHNNPVNFVSELKPIIHMVISDNDTVLSPHIARNFFEQLPNPGRYVTIPDAAHSVRGDESEIINQLTN